MPVQSKGPEETATYARWRICIEELPKYAESNTLDHHIGCRHITLAAGGLGRGIDATASSIIAEVSRFLKAFLDVFTKFPFFFPSAAACWQAFPIGGAALSFDISESIIAV